MNGIQIVHRVLECLDTIGIPYMLVGSFASNIYGIARQLRMRIL